MARILYLDDEEALAFLVTRMLKLLGHEPAAYTSPEEALGAYRAEPERFDLVLTDLSMPTMTGLEFAQQILEIRAGAAVGVLTGHADPKNAAAAKCLGVRDVIDKPSTLEQMESALGALLSPRSD